MQPPGGDSSESHMELSFSWWVYCSGGWFQALLFAFKIMGPISVKKEDKPGYALLCDWPVLATRIHQFFSHIRALQIISGWSFTLGLFYCPHLYIFLSVNMTFVLFFFDFSSDGCFCADRTSYRSRFSARRHPTHCPINHSDTAQLCLFW